MRILYCLCLVINFCCIYMGTLYLFIHGIREGKAFDVFLRFKYYRFKRLGETLGLFVFPCMFLTLCGGKSKWVKMDDLVVPPSITHSWV